MPTTRKSPLVLFVSPTRDAYGSERSMLALLDAAAFRAEVVCPEGGTLERELRTIGISIHPLEFGKYSLHQNPIWHICLYRRLCRIIRSRRPDVIVINLDGNTPLVTLAARRHRIPVIRFSRFEFKPPARFIDRWSWLRADAIVCPSNLVKDQVLGWIPAHYRSRVHCLYEVNSTTLASPEGVRRFRALNELGSFPVIGFVGRLHRIKRIECIVDSLPQVQAAVGDVRFVIVGGFDGSPSECAYKLALEERATRLGVRDSLKFTGYIEHPAIADAVASFNVQVLPSASESFGLALVEAWAQCVPTIATDASGCREITLASGGGLLFPSGDHVALASNLLRLLRDHESARKHGIAGRRWVQTHCVPAQYAKRFEQIVSKVCKTSTSPTARTP